MVFGLSIGEAALVLGAAVAVFGPKDIPVIARALGKISGKAVGYVHAARGQLDHIMQRTQVDQVHKELQETMAQLEAIRHEIRSGMSILQPLPLTREVLNPSTSVFKLVKAKGSDHETTPIGCVNLLKSVHQSAVVKSTASSLDNAFESPRYMGTQLKVGACPSSADTTSRATAEITGNREFFVLPVSAAMAGPLSSKKGALTGSNLVLESVEEQKIALEALEFLQQSETVRTLSRGQNNRGC